jgi:heme/copper-type cytochrome/quinol oxidase subunit 2
MHQFIMDKNKYKSVVHYSLKFESIAIDTDDLIEGSKRLIETNNPVILPYSVPIKILVTSADVLHS